MGVLGGILVVIVGFGWLGKEIIKDSCTKQVPKGTDIRQAFLDINSGKYSAKEVDRMMSRGYYVKK